MKKISRFSFFAAILTVALMSFSGSVHAQTTEQKVFGNTYGLFVVINNKARFYEFDGDSFAHNSRMDFTLPVGYKSVYGYADAICVIVNDKVRYYKHNGAKWVIDSVLPEFALPAGYGSVFGSKRNIGAVCVVVNNKVQLYGFSGKIWRTDPVSDFTLPDGYRAVFGGSDGIGVAAGNKAQFYAFTGASGWVADSRYDLVLPDGYVTVFGCKNDFNKWESVFVVMNDSVQFYAFDTDTNSWATDSDWVFRLPEK